MQSPNRKAIIYFWSGTGNSFRIATWIKERAEAAGLNTNIISVDSSNLTKDIIPNKNRLIGLVFPTHGFTAPWHILKFAFRLPRGNGSQAFCIAARAGLKFGSVYPPGISGSATFIVALIMILKGYKVRGSLSVDMPSNWFSLHPIQKRKNLDAIIKRGEKKVAHFIETILQRRMVWFTLNNLYELFWGTLLSLISVGYLFFGRFFLAKLFFANNDCEGCGICADHCSVNAIKMWGKENPTPFWKYNCESCMRCAAFCPHNAIEAGHSWGVTLYFVTVIPMNVYLLSWLEVYIPGISSFKDKYLGDLLNLLYFYPAIFISYYIFFALIQIPAINWIFTHTTMTHFWGRYREPNIKLKNLVSNKKIL